MSDTPVLVVDLDGTLIHTDTLVENFWAALATSPSILVTAASALFSGPAALKAALADASALDVAVLPYNAAVLEFVTAWRAAGGRTALVTAADRRIAEAVARHVGLFDEVHGSDGEHNLKGEAKAAFLTGRFGLRGFDYIGDAAADLPVWRQARRVIVVAPSERLAARLDAGGQDVVTLANPRPGWADMLRMLRVYQWLKNLLIFVPLIAAHEGRVESWLVAGLGFLAFSFAASSAYILNDLLDLTADRHHPRKKQRPVAAGRIGPLQASLMVPVLLVLGVLVAILTGKLEFIGIVALYYALTMGYSLVLKRRLIVDICALAGLYTLRVLAGGAVTGIHLSEWLLAFSMFIFLSLAAMKRQAELVATADRGQSEAKGRAYQVGDLPIVATISVAAGYMAVLVLALYINSPEVQQLYRAPAVLWACCPILLYWVSRMAMITHRGKMQDDPLLFVLRDRVGLLCIAGVLLVALLGSVF
ncbi:UbiA family prenyltransferase [Radicibacter daui]|uniref:UbiA family prenyltransferase n=1 Tax=Radicibacter daui TaxID=3064829 RepID=UPI004046E492